MDLSLIFGLAGIIIGLASIFLGIWIGERVLGKLKRAVIFLIIATIIFILEMVAEIPNLLGTTVMELVRGIAHIGIILFILFAVINMKRIIDGIDGHHKKDDYKKF